MLPLTTMKPQRQSLTSVAVGVLVFGHAAIVGSVQETVAPKPAPGVSQPAYPAAARAAGIEGEVRYRAAIRADGSVASVDIISVPATGVGFEEEVQRAVTSWRFVPATLRGVASPSEYSGAVRFTVSIPQESIYPLSSHAAWTQVRALAADLKLRIRRADDRQQLLIGESPYRSSLPDASILELPTGFAPESVEFHVFVAPGVEPAHVAIGSVLYSRHIDPGRRQMWTSYATDALHRWFAAKLSARAGVTAEPLAGSAERRAEQARRLMPADVHDDCSIRPAVLLEQADRAKTNVTMPQVISEVKPLYPKEQLMAAHQSVVLFAAEMTEHGTLMNMKHLKPIDASDDFKRAAQLAATLWRFQPGVVNGCRARMTVTLQMSFSAQ
jgi:TonB family protein